MYYPVPVSFYDTVGFTFNGENLGMGCTERTVRHLLETECRSWRVSEGDDVHDLVVQLARARNETVRLDHSTYDIAAFDSDDLPKAIESGSVDDDEQCMCCFEPIAECA